jgi:hypothetical protein
MKQHCSACVLPGSVGVYSGSSFEYPVDKILFASASTRTAPTQNLVGMEARDGLAQWHIPYKPCVRLLRLSGDMIRRP